MLHKNVLALLKEFGVPAAPKGGLCWVAERNRYGLRWYANLHDGEAARARGAVFWRYTGDDNTEWEWMPSKGQTGPIFRHFVMRASRINHVGDGFALQFGSFWLGKNLNKRLAIDRGRGLSFIDHPEALAIADGWRDGDPVGVLLDWLKEKGHIPE
jgi:hypothetical protein